MNGIVSAREVRVHINREVYKTPNPTTGDALYALAGVLKHEKLYIEVQGNAEDRMILRDENSIELSEDVHLYSQETFEILVNGDEHRIDTVEITYTRVIDLYVGSGGKASNEYLVKYSRGHIEQLSGTLPPGQKVKVKDGMRFRVSGTGES